MINIASELILVYFVREGRGGTFFFCGVCIPVVMLTQRNAIAILCAHHHKNICVPSAWTESIMNTSLPMSPEYMAEKEHVSKMRKGTLSKNISKYSFVANWLITAIFPFTHTANWRISCEWRQQSWPEATLNVFKSRDDAITSFVVLPSVHASLNPTAEDNGQSKKTTTDLTYT